MPLSGDEVSEKQIRVAAATPNIFRSGHAGRTGAGLHRVRWAPLSRRRAAGAGNLARSRRHLRRRPAAAVLSSSSGSPATTRPAILAHPLHRRRPHGSGRRLEPVVELLLPTNVGMERAPELWSAARIDYANGSRINYFLRITIAD